jgi:hypothetical protein
MFFAFPTVTTPTYTRPFKYIKIIPLLTPIISQFEVYLLFENKEIKKL